MRKDIYLNKCYMLKIMRLMKLMELNKIALYLCSIKNNKQI